MSYYRNCRLCPRRCGVNRDEGFRGYCGETAALRCAYAGIHWGEEPPIVRPRGTVGTGGSGTVFITGCNLGCAFCQNFQISQKGMGRVVDSAEFAEICLALEGKGAKNINIVTGSHAAPALALGIEAARKRGLTIPILWNSSGYDGAETLEILKDFIDVYLPDLKTLDSNLAAKFFNAPDYPEHASAAILKMMENRKLQFSPKQDAASELMVSGVMVRHLVIPGHMEATRQVLSWFSENCNGRSRGKARGRALLSLMTQYTPVHVPGAKSKIPGAYVSDDEYQTVLSMLTEFGIDDGYCQELVTGSEWLPDFTRRNPFSSELSLPVWHWEGGFV